MPFQKGKSGNPKGRPKGIKDSRIRFREAMEKDLPDVIAAMLRAAKEGDVSAGRAILDKTLPSPSKGGAFIRLELPAKATPAQKAERITDAMLAGEIDADSASVMLANVEKQARVEELADLVPRLHRLEEAIEAIHRKNPMLVPGKR
ncbi:DUF5681 domain-containing protein [Lentisalinibacter orientalis]|uniref:DUF5681 domain-containing protein n=1 Tax=Lentisalinibacter orientalis TaxID=2992241 RepID=UPI00386E3FD2